MKIHQKMALFAATALFLLWVISNYARLSDDGTWVVRLVLGTIFFLAIMIRWKRAKESTACGSHCVLLLGVAGAVMSVLGIIFAVHQFEWLGMMILIYACLRWALPEHWNSDILLAVFLLYWVHPLPWQVLGHFQLFLQELSVKGSPRSGTCVIVNEQSRRS